MKKQKYVTGSNRRVVARPQPPMQDRRTKRERTRAAAKRSALRDAA